MLQKTLIELFERDLKKLRNEISSYKDEENIWKIEKSIFNSAGNLTLHLIGNLSHFICATLGNNGYVRDRQKEFLLKNISSNILVEEIEKLRREIKKTLLNIQEEDFDKIYPINVFEVEKSTEFFLIHLSTHLNYHLGQINYHRRLLDN